MEAIDYENGFILDDEFIGETKIKFMTYDGSLSDKELGIVISDEHTHLDIILSNKTARNLLFVLTHMLK